jgi:diamine N-acetyltransferase
VGAALIGAAIRKAKSLGAEKLVLYSNKVLQPAIHLYRKFGFKEVELEEGRLARCNIKMELQIPAITIISAGPDHASIIAAIGRESFSVAFVDFFNKKEDLDQYIRYTYDPGKIAASLHKPGNVFFIAYYADEPAGFVKIKKQSFNKHLSSQQQMELQKIYVLKKFYGRGVADALLREAISMAEESGVEHLWLDVITENARAIRFYQKNNFTRCGDHSFLIGSQTFYYNVMSLPVTMVSKISRTMSGMI